MAKEDVQSDTALLVPEMQILCSGIMNDIVIYHRLPFQIFETLRSQERQQWLFDQGYSKTLKSNHSTGRAFDLVVFYDNKYSWADKDLYLYRVMVELVTAKFGDKIQCGGNWTAFRDYPHIELK